MSISCRFLSFVVFSAIWISIAQTLAPPDVYLNSVDNVGTSPQTITIPNENVNGRVVEALSGASSDQSAPPDPESNDSEKSLREIQYSHANYYERLSPQSTSSEEKLTDDLLNRLNVSNNGRTAEKSKPDNLKSENDISHVQHLKHHSDSDFGGTFNGMHQNDVLGSVELMDASDETKEQKHTPAESPRGHVQNVSQISSANGKKFAPGSLIKHTGDGTSENPIQNDGQFSTDELLRPSTPVTEGSATEAEDAIGEEDYRCSYYEDDKAVVIPRGLVIGQVGEPINVLCQLNPAYVSQSSVANLTVMETGGDVTVEKKLDSNTSQSLSFTVLRPGSFLLKCVDLGNKSSFCYRKLYVGYPPLDVENFDCICHDYGDMECWFDVPYNPVQNLQNYSICVVQENGMCDTKSPTRDGLEHQRWKFDNCFVSSRGVIFNVTAHNELGHASFLHTIDMYTRVRLGEARDVKFKPQRHPLIFYLEWDASVDALMYPVLARVNITSLFWNNSSLERGSSTKLMLPYHSVRYNVTVELQPDAPGALYWSYPVSVVINTTAAPPIVPPSAAPGMFEATGTLAEPLSVLLYWLPVPPAMHAGHGFGYVAEAVVRTNNFSDCEDLIRTHTIDDNYTVFKNLSHDNNYSFKVYSVNHCLEETSGASTTLCRSDKTTSYGYAAAGSVRPAKPAFLTTLNYYSSFETMRWYPRDGRPANFTLYYCTEDETPCKTGVRYHSVNNKTSVNISLASSSPAAGTVRLQDFTGYRPGDELHKSLRFAVSADCSFGNDVVSSGVVWAKCRYTPHAEAPPQLGHFNATSRSVVLAWQWRPKEKCPPTSVVAVQIVVCGLRTCEDRVNVPVWQTTFPLKELQSNSHYTARLRVLHDDGREPTYSNLLSFSTLPKVLLWWQVTLIVSGTLVLLSVTVVVFHFSHRCVLSSLKEAMEPLPVPDFHGDSMSIAFPRKPTQSNKVWTHHETLATSVGSSQRPAPEVTTIEEEHSLLKPPHCYMEGIRALNAPHNIDTDPQDAPTTPNEDGLLEEKTVLLSSPDEAQTILPYTTLQLLSEDEDEEIPSKLGNVTQNSDGQQTLHLEQSNYGYVLAQPCPQTVQVQEAENHLQNQCIPYVAIGTQFPTSARFSPSRVSVEQNSVEAEQHLPQPGMLNYVHPEASPYVLASFVSPEKKPSLPDSEMRKHLDDCDAQQANETNEETDESVASSHSRDPRIKFLSQQDNSPYVQVTSQIPTTLKSIPDFDSLNLRKSWSNVLHENDTADLKLNGVELPSHSPCMNVFGVQPHVPNTKIFGFTSADIDRAKNFSIRPSNFAATSILSPDKGSGTTNIITGVNIPGHGHTVFLTSQAIEQPTQEQAFDATTYDEGLGYSPTAKEIEGSPYVTCAQTPRQDSTESEDRIEAGSEGFENRHRRPTQSSRVSDLGVVSDFDLCSDDDGNPDSSPDSTQVKFLPDWNSIGLDPSASTVHLNECTVSQSESSAFDTNLNYLFEFSDENLAKILAPLHSKMKMENRTDL